MQVSSSTTSTNGTILSSDTCLVNEYGPNCSFCISQNSCVDGHYTCDVTTGSKVCLPGYNGKECKTPIGKGTKQYHVTCPENECRNGGTCVSGRCCCLQGFMGVLCEVEIIECEQNSCLNGGKSGVF